MARMCAILYLSATPTPNREHAMTTESLSTIIARIIAVHASQGTPLDSFIDSRPADLSDLCTDLGIPLEQAVAAQAAMLIADGVAKVKHPDDRIGGLYEATLKGVAAGLTAR